MGARPAITVFLFLTMPALAPGQAGDKRGPIVGALLGAGLGVVAGSALGEADVSRGELMVGTIGLGMAGGGLLGALFGTAVPRWKRSYP